MQEIIPVILLIFLLCSFLPLLFIFEVWLFTVLIIMVLFYFYFVYLLFKLELHTCFHDGTYLSFITGCITSLSIFGKAGLVAMNFLNFCLTWKVFIASFLKDKLIEYRKLGWQLFSFRTWNTSLHSFLDYTTSTEKSAVKSEGYVFKCDDFFLLCF
jgi:hypothetical protein